MKMERKLTAILCADVYGYSRLMGEDEEATIRTLSSYRKIIDSLIETHRGRFVNSAGDSVLAEFISVVEAVNCAIEIQTTLKAENQNLPPQRRMEFRIGINLGDVMIEGEQIYGDGVNVAARLESLAEPGGICISGKIHDEIGKKLRLNYEDLGPMRVKNISDPVRVFRVSPGASSPQFRRRVARKYRRAGIFSIAGLAIIGLIIVLVQHISMRAPITTASIPAQQERALRFAAGPSIAVLPFTNLSGDPKQDYFSDGITDYLITDLSRLSGMLVIARNSTFTYKGKSISVQQIGKELGVRTVLEGSVFKALGQVRISVQLVDAANGANLWAARFDKPLKDVFSVQDEIVREIVSTLNLMAKAQTLKLPVSRIQPTNNLEAFDFWLKGLEETDLTQEGYLRSRSMFEKAIALDPNYADAHAALAYNYMISSASIVQYDKDPIAAQRAIQLARRAIALDDSNWLAYVVLGEAYAYEHQYDRAIAYYQRAITLDPNNPIIYYWFGDVLGFVGRTADQISVGQRAARLDPRNADVWALEIGQAYNWAGMYAEALPFLKQHATHYPDNIIAHGELAICYINLGHHDEARTEAAEILRLNPRFSLKDIEKQSCPFMNEAICKRMQDSVRRAGLT